MSERSEGNRKEELPGTPKHPLFSESFRLPPLTPPPSYYSSYGSKLSKVRPKQTRFVKAFFKHHVSRPSFSWSSSSSSSSSSFSSPRSRIVHRAKTCYLSCSRSYVKDDDEEEIGSSSPTSTLCYKRGFNSSMGSMKRALSSVLSYRSSRNDLRLI
ncbi:BnaC03g22700D [Brassica napus]|uniref:BnaC03g22700D protein n=1 Tax=Brassica napus TaxID=3708 RepID=A0A078GI77_BRANA|nr:BnaC03g22700D [Brassica napus]